ncbi:imidazolonepropionase [Aneurinibacillus migulanus]|uniref:Imidazolonepropionase n=1 Tax=Aneurinibacillus migulanus TaxID=47500 RepID=A0A0D1YLY7_ANEMI|nr:imidazolonepropionase [Aneurinibacillus migulanus]KIV59752.1 imidazolonepropionase [Aneurinibacillus migulanus]KON84155.1 imidazolonepropionase [Aneurinibacillus migulanus]MED0890793.1 imidazolonepropionase [Aneurinibacillus migulanus]MED1618473.1 imidazolonepropionase [Aneurinibacillus migulanus]SDJ82784.1 imidazolonepropionase [Aneurinibacillus migulanus]
MSKKITFIRNASQLVTLAGSSDAPLTGKKMDQLNIIENGGLWIEDGLIEYVGVDGEVAERYKDRIGEAEIIDATGKLVTPGLVDPHTHLVYAGSRENEFNMRLQGATYMEIMNQGGGIHATTSATREASHEVLFEEGRKRLDQFLLHGVTTIEAKSGYGLTLEHEIKQLEVAGQLHEQHPVDIVRTFMGAHAVPSEYKADPDVFVDKVIHEMIPEVARRNLAEFNDVFCERGVFTPEQSKRILEAGINHGLLPKIHADEIEPYEGAELAASIGAVSADHLLRASDKGIAMMAEAGVIAVLLPGTAFFLMAESADGRKMIDAGVPVALSTDCNPGSSPTVSTPLIMNLGCLRMGMTSAEVLTAATINAAHAIKRGKEIGSLEKGKKADIVIFDVPNYMQLQYRYGVNHAHTVLKGGVIVVDAGRLVCNKPTRILN